MPLRYTVRIPDKYAPLHCSNEEPYVLKQTDCALSVVDGQLRFVELRSVLNMQCFIGMEYTEKVKKLLAAPGIIRKKTKKSDSKKKQVEFV